VATPRPAVTTTVGVCPPQSPASKGLHGRVDTKWTPPETSPHEGRYSSVHDARPHMQMLTVKQAAARLAVSTAAVYAWVDDGVLSHVRLFDHAIRINESDLARFVSDRQK
jgi:excisionase family DNA binding protein